MESHVYTFSRVTFLNHGPRVCGQSSVHLFGVGSSLRDYLALPALGQNPNRFFPSLCAAVFHWGPTQSLGELRSDFQPLALDFLSFVEWTTDYTTQLPVISALGLPCPGTSPLQEVEKSFLKEEDIPSYPATKNHLFVCLVGSLVFVVVVLPWVLGLSTLRLLVIYAALDMGDIL